MIPYVLYPLTNQREFVDHSTEAATISRIAYKVVSALADVGDWLLRQIRREQTIRALSALSDDILIDIGVRRDAIPVIAEALLDAPLDGPLSRPLGQAVRPAPRPKEPVADNDNETDRRFSAII